MRQVGRKENDALLSADYGDRYILPPTEGALGIVSGISSVIFCPLPELMGALMSNSTIAPKHPDGSVQGLCTGALTMFALLIAYMGYTSLKNPNPWRVIDLFIQIIPLSVAAIALVLV